MSYNRVSAMGVERGLVSPEEQFNAQRTDAARRAQMAALMAGAGQAGPIAGGGATEDIETAFARAHPQGGPEIIGNAGTPYAPIDAFNRQTKAGMDMQGLVGSQQMDLQKQRGTDYLNAVRTQMEPANAKIALEKSAREAENARKAELKKQFDAITNANPNIDENGVWHVPELEPDFKPGPAHGGFSPYERMQIGQSIENDGQLPDIEGQRARTRMLDYQGKELERTTRANDQAFDDAQVNREATQLANQGNVQEANALRQKSGLAKEYKDPKAIQADTKLVAALQEMEKLASGYDAWWRTSGWDKGLFGANTKAQQNELIKGQLNMLIGRFVQDAQQKGFDPEQAKLLAIEKMRPQMGKNYVTDF